MSVLRRVAAVVTAVVLGVVLVPTAAHADFTFYRTSPHVGACWHKVNAYGGVYQVTNNLLNGTSAWQSVTVQVYRPGVGYQSSQTYSAAPGQWVQGQTANVAIFPDDDYRVFLNGAQVVGMPAHGIPYYMSHCKVKESPSPTVRSALSYGLDQLDALYTGCAAGDYRMGKVAPYNLWHDGRTCGQSRVYYQPAGTKGFDCSGLVYKMFQWAGVYFPWTWTGSMKSGIPQVAKSQIQVGDLLVKNDSGGGHVAVYLGDGDGDGVASVLEATPKWQNPDGSWTGVVLSDATKYLTDGTYTAHRGSDPADQEPEVVFP